MEADDEERQEQEGKISHLKRMTGEESSQRGNKEENHPKKTNYNKK